MKYNHTKPSWRGASLYSSLATKKRNKTRYVTYYKAWGLYDTLESENGRKDI